jgi:two-component system, OmpR family, phosphate regulon sensor histidine kinase PhoR
LGFVNVPPLNKTNITFAFLSLYIIAAFAWWTYAHILENKEIYSLEKNQIEIECYKATLDVNGAITQEMFNDSNGVKRYFYLHFPKLEILFEPQHANDFSNFLIRPKEDSYLELEKKLSRKIWMYTSEGIAMVLLLFWGIILIYRSLQNQLNLKRQQTNFLLSITHELKTPIASIKLYLETIRKRKLDEAQTKTILQNSLSDVERLNDLVENLLLASQLESHKYEPVAKKVNLSELANETFDRFALPRDSQFNFKKEIAENLYIVADENAIFTVISNLLSNAAKYSPPKELIEIILKLNEDKIILSISNNGPNISDEDKKSIFTKFYRAGDENVRKTKGTGLGLFIVKNLLNLHQAEISVRDKQPQGAIFDIIFKSDE